MPTNVRNAESAYLAARARTRRWFANFMANWNAPLVEGMVMDFWQTLPPEARAQLKDRNPEAYREVAEKLDGLIRQRGGEPMEG